MRPETDLWWAQARRDFRVAKRNHGHRDYDAAVFYCEQATQKALKAVLLHRLSRTPPKIHNLVELGRLTGIDARLSAFLAALGPHYMLTRYPDAAGAVTSTLYDGRLSLKMLRGTERVMNWCRSRLR